MSYPSLEQYNYVMQHPETALVDSELKKGKIATTGLGLPLALCGGFALTYTITSGGKKYAVRCFHKQSNNLEKRYRAISSRLDALHSSYFVKFEFQPEGVTVDRQKFPVVKMAWASGITLGEFMGVNYHNKSFLQELNKSLLSLATYLEKESIAHGDIQPGNVMVAKEGQSVQLIDYDGMFVDDLKSLGGTEWGLRNFQHPGRTGITWDFQLDRFSFIVLNLAIRVLEVYPDLWDKTQSDENGILFRAQDFADPCNSDIFQRLVGDTQFKDDARNFASICKSSFDKIPTSEDFLAKRNIPQVAITISSTGSLTRTAYLSAYPVIDATNYELCLQRVGDRVEIIGQIVGIKQGLTRYRTPYVFLNFDHWVGNISKIIIWSEALATFPKKPDESWIGKWISVVGLMEPPYQTTRYSHVSITIAQANQLHEITEKEAQFRLFGSEITESKSLTRAENREILESLRRVSPSTSLPVSIQPPSVTPKIVPAKSQPSKPTPVNPSSSVQVRPTFLQSAPTTSNQTILRSMKTHQPVSGVQQVQLQSQQSKSKPVTKKQGRQKKVASRSWLVSISKIGIIMGVASIIVTGLFFLSYPKFLQSSPNSAVVPTNKPILTATSSKSTQSAPDILATKSSSCIPWTEVNEDFEGDIKCIYGLVDSKRSFTNNGDFSYTLIRFSYDPNSFYLTSHNRPLYVSIGDCVSAESVVSYDANGVPFMEMSKITKDKYSCSK